MLKNNSNMKKSLFSIIGILVLCCACNYTGKSSTNRTAKKYIYVVKNVNGYNVAYTEDGHTMLYANDSTGNYSVFYVKFENGAGKYGLKGIEEKIVRAEMDATLTTLNCFVTIQGGAFCKVDSIMEYSVCFFDEHLNCDSLAEIRESVECTQIKEMEIKQEVKRISELLNIAHNISLSINKNDLSGWSNIVYALEPTQELINFDVMLISDVYDQRVQKRLPRIHNIAIELTEFYKTLREKMITQNRNTIQ